MTMRRAIILALLALLAVVSSSGTKAVFTGSTSTGGSAATGVSYNCSPGYAGEVSSTSGLLNYWRLGETSGTSAADSKGSNPGTYVNSPTLNQAAARESMSGNPSVLLNGTNQYVNNSDINDFTGTAAFTIETWVKRTSASSVTDRIVTKEGTSGSFRTGYALSVKPAASGYTTTMERFDGTATIDTVSSRTRLELNRWYHVVATYNSTQLKMYIDGVLENTTSTSRSLANTSNPFRIGADHLGGNTFHGGVDEVAVYNVALSDAVIQGHTTGCATFTPEAKVSATHGCRISTNKSAYCWGDNTYGQIGVNNTTTPQLNPQLVLGGFTWKSISPGNNFTCGVTTTDVGYCWGRGNTYQLGNNNTGNALTPTPVSGGLTWKTISATKGTGSNACGVTTGNKVYCWGLNDSGNIGNGSASGTSTTTPAATTGNYDYLAVEVGTNHACGLTTVNGSYCWGENSNGKLGNNSTTNSTTPVVSQNGYSWKELMIGAGGQTCGIQLSDNKGFCWGSNSSGKFGDGTTTNSMTPVAINGNRSWDSLATGSNSTCGIEMGTNLVYCWGVNAVGQLGNNLATTQHYTPAVVTGGFQFKNIYSTNTGICGTISTNLDKCWGANTTGRLGTGDTNQKNVPTSTLITTA